VLDGEAAAETQDDRSTEPRGNRPLDRGALNSLIGPSVRVVRNILTGRIIAAHAALGARPGMFSMMALISANPGCLQTELAREFRMDKSAVMQLLDELEAKGCIRRERSHSDRRRYHLTMTPAGTQLFEAMRPVTARVEQPLHDALSAAELDLLQAMLRRVRDALEASPMAGD
jgi:DNA-binding MarR family transcriptional regulator